MLAAFFFATLVAIADPFSPVALLVVPPAGGQKLGHYYAGATSLLFLLGRQGRQLLVDLVEGAFQPLPQIVVFIDLGVFPTVPGLVAAAGQDPVDEDRGPLVVVNWPAMQDGR